MNQANQPPLFLGFGSDDDFAFAGSLVAATLPRERASARARVVHQGGGHDWETWTPSSATLLQRARPLLAEGRDIRCPAGASPDGGADAHPRGIPRPPPS